MNYALFGGTFDPVHNGHLAVARAALQDARFGLDQLMFVPANVPPFKESQPVTSYETRFAMLMLALEQAREPRFSASRLEDPRANPLGPNYSIETVRRFRTHLKPQDELFFLTGVDAFAAIAKWREPEALLVDAKFIVVSRPGFFMGNALAALPAGLGHLRNRVYLLETVHEDVSSTAIRAAVRGGDGLEKLVPAPVAKYIRKQGLYR